MVHAVKKRLLPVAHGRIEGFVAWTSPAWVLGTYALGLLVSGVLGLWFPLTGALLCTFFTVLLWAETSGRFSLFRRLVFKQPSYNLVVPIHDQPKRSLGTVVISANLDSPSWRPKSPSWLRRPMKAVIGAAIVVTSLLYLSVLAQPWGRPTQSMYLVALIVLGVTVAMGVLMQRRTDGGDEDASGPAVLLELIRRVSENPPPNTQIWGVFTGCGHAYQNGMAAFLAMHGKTLPDPVFVVALDDPGRGPVGGVVSEGSLFAQAHRPTGPALVERLRWAGVEIPIVDKAGETDARAALLAGYRAIALSGCPGAQPDVESALFAADVAERLVRWFDEDLARIEVDAPLLERFQRPRPDEVDS